MPEKNASGKDPSEQDASNAQDAPSGNAAGEELAVGESLVTKETEDLIVETTRSEETLFTRTYTDPDTGELRLALQVDVTTGKTALDPRHIDEAFWTLVAGGEEHPMSALRAVLGRFADPSIEVKPEKQEIHVRPEEDAA